MQTLTEQDVARLFRCSTAGLRRMRREGRGPVWIKVGRLVRYPAPLLEDFIASNVAPKNTAVTPPRSSTSPNQPRRR